MKFLPLIWRNLMRRKIRTIFTTLSIFIAFLLFGFLMAIKAAFGDGDRRRRRRSADDDPQGLVHPAAAEELPGAHPCGRRGHGDHARQLVRRHLPGPEQLHRRTSRSSRRAACDVPGVRAARGAEAGVVRQSHRRHRRHRHGEAVRLEGRRPRPAAGHDLPEAGRLAVGVHDRRDLRLAGRRAPTRPSSSSTTTT